MSHGEAKQFNNVGASQTFNLTLGGRYLASIVATWNSGTIKLQVLGPDGSTYLDIYAAYDSSGEQDEPINSWSANAAKIFDLPPGTYKFLFSASNTPSAAYINIARAPLN